MKIRTKMFLIILVILVLSIGSLVIAVPIGISGKMTADAENRLLEAKKAAQLVIDQNLEAFTEDGLKQHGMDIVKELATMLNLRVSVYSKSMMLADSSNLFEDMTDEIGMALKGETAYRRTVDHIYFAFPIGNLGAMRIIYPTDLINETTSQARSLITIIGLFILLFSAAVAIILSQSFTKPIAKLNEQSKRIMSGDYNLASQSWPGDEIGELAQSFKAMSSEIKNRIDQLEQSLEREKKLKDMQKNFLNSVTHEFKTPLTSIIGYADLLTQYKDDPALLENGTAVIRKEGQRLYETVEKVLYLSRLDRFDFPLQIEEIDLVGLIDRSIEGILIKAGSYGVTIHKNIDCSCSVRGDFEMLYRVLLNLLDNSIKYNRENGSVSLDAAKEDQYVRITIKDTGIGIGKEHLQRIFEPFYREDKTRSRKMGGDGLGLAIVKEIIEKHKGQVSINSEKGKGTEVMILLPA